MIDYAWKVVKTVTTDNADIPGAVTHIYWELTAINYDNQKTATRADVTHYIVKDITQPQVAKETEEAILTDVVVEHSSIKPDTFIPVTDLTEELLLGWVQADLQTKGIYDSILAYLTSQVE